MLSLAHIEVALTANDAARMLRSKRKPGAPHIHDVQFGHGEAMLELTLPGLFSLPVDLTVALAGVRDGDVHVRLAWTNLALLPGAVKQAGLGRAVAALGLGEFWDGHGGLAIPLVYIQARLAASFEVEHLELTPDRLLVRLRNVQAVSPRLVGVGSGKRNGGSKRNTEHSEERDHDHDGELAEDEHASTGPDEIVLIPDGSPSSGLQADVTRLSDAAPSSGHATLFDAQQRRRYDEWRERLLQWSRSKLPPSLQAALPWVLLVPDLSVLLGRMLLDRRLSPPVRALLGAVLVYVLSPVDLVPDPIPVAGAIDDLSLILLTLSQLQGQGQGEIMQEHWSGDGEPLRIIRDGLQFLRQRFRNVLRLMQQHKVRLRRRTR